MVLSCSKERKKHTVVFEIWSLKMHQRFSAMFFKRLMKQSVRFMLSFPRQINNYLYRAQYKEHCLRITYIHKTVRYKGYLACPAVHLKNFIAKHYGEVILHTSSKRNLIYKAKQFGQDQTMLFFPLRLWKKNWHAQLVNVDTYLLVLNIIQSLQKFMV